MQPALASYSPSSLAFGGRAMACVAALLLVVAPPAAAQRPPGAQPVVGVKPPVSLPTYAVEVAAIKVSPTCTPVVGRRMTIHVILRNIGNTVASGVPWLIALNTGPIGGSSTVVGQGTWPSVRGMDTITVVAIPSVPRFTVHGSLAPNGPVPANTAPVASQALDVPAVASPFVQSTPTAGGGGGGSGPSGVVPGRGVLPPCP